MPEVELFKTVSVNLFFNIEETSPYQINSTSCYADINIQFIPDEVIIKNISVRDNDINAAGAQPIYLITSDLLNDPVMFHFPLAQTFHEMLNIPFLLKKQISGKYVFRILSMNMIEPENKATFNMFCAITLLFVKYKNNKIDV